MTKIFDPKITPGPWCVYVTDEFPPGWIGIRQDINTDTLTETHIATLGRFEDPRDKINAKAIAAVPELIDVLKAAREVKDTRGRKLGWSIVYEEQMNNLIEAIKKIDERDV